MSSDGAFLASRVSGNYPACTVKIKKPQKLVAQHSANTPSYSPSLMWLVGLCCFTTPPGNPSGMPEVFAFSFLNQIPIMKNVLSAFKFTLPALLLVAAFFLFASDGGHYALFPAVPDATTIVHAETTGGHFAPPREP